MGLRRSYSGGRVLRFEAIEARLLLAADWTGLDQVRATYGLTGKGQTVAVIDTGVAYTHAALGGGFGAGYRVTAGYDFADEAPDPYDRGPAGAHGTHIAGVIASSDAAHLGVAPGVDLAALRVVDDSGQGSLGLIDQALQWVHSHRNSLRYPITTVNISLGAGGNFSTLPDWAFLESDLAQLQSDGIFVAVAAGNGFSSMHTVGVDYPAASPYVVPVAAADASGTMSAMSQRNARALVAPGIGIVSTLPDYVGNHNGRDDDFGAASGTSEAAAFVAGASALLREAYGRAGLSKVTEMTLYQTLVNTADTIHDNVTGLNYSRINLARAVESVLHGSGTTPQPTPPGPAATAWGSVRQQSFPGYAVGAQGQWFTVTASISGILTIEATSSPRRGNLHVDLMDATGKPSGAGSGNGGLVRIDVPASAGEVFSLHAYNDSVSGALTPVDFRVTNLVSQSSRTVNVQGTGGNDQFAFTAGAALQASINGVTYTFSRKRVDTVTFNGQGGADSASLLPAAGSQTLVLRSGFVDLLGAGYDVRTCATSKVSIDGGGGTAVVSDFNGSDRLTAAGTQARIDDGVTAVTLDHFRQIAAQAGPGATRKTQLSAVDFILQLSGPWL